MISNPEPNPCYDYYNYVFICVINVYESVSVEYTSYTYALYVCVLACLLLKIKSVYARYDHSRQYICKSDCLFMGFKGFFLFPRFKHKALPHTDLGRSV